MRASFLRGTLSRRHGLASFLTIMAGALLLLIPAMINGGPFLYRDTATYIKGADMGATKLLGERFGLPAPAPAGTPAAGSSLTSVDEGVIIAGRSVYYGALLYLALLAGLLILAVIVQAIVVSYTVHSFFKAVCPLSARAFLLLISILSVATPLGYFTDLTMPDVFAGLAILIIATLLCAFPALGRWDRIALFLILAFAMLSHSSHLPLAIALGGGGLAVAVRTLRARQWTIPAMLITGAILIGFAGEFAFVQVATRVLGAAPLRLPHLSAHLVEMGPGTVYLNAHCPAARFAICTDRAKFPVYWEDFLFSTAPDRGVFGLADAGRKREISGEQVRFAAAVLRDQPVAVGGGFGLSFLRQIAMFRTDEIAYTPDVLEAFATRLPAAEYARVLRSRATAGGAMEVWLTATTYILIIASMVATAVLLGHSRGEPWAPAERRLLAAAGIIAAGVAINAGVCGIIASPYDRFQARVIWLVPVIAAAIWSMMRKRTAADATRSPDAGTSPAGSS